MAKIKIKKCSAVVYKKLLTFNKDQPKNTKLDEAFEIITDKCNIEGEIVPNELKEVRCFNFNIYKDEELIHTLQWSMKNGYDYNAGDFDWNSIYKEVLSYVLKNRLASPKKITKSRRKMIEKQQKITFIK